MVVVDQHRSQNRTTWIGVGRLEGSNFQAMELLSPRNKSGQFEEYLGESGNLESSVEGDVGPSRKSGGYIFLGILNEF